MPLDSMGDGMGDSMEALIIGVFSPGSAVTFSVPVAYVPDPLTAAGTLTEFGQTVGPYPAAATQGLDGVWFLSITLPALPAGFAAGTVLFQPGTLTLGVFATEGPIIPGTLLADAAAAPTVTLTGSLVTQAGLPAAKVTLHIGGAVSVQPLLAGGAFDSYLAAYPGVLVPVGGFPDPVPLFPAAPPALAGSAGENAPFLQRVVTGADGTFSLTLPFPNALAYAAGARTDADLDPARGGRYSVQFVVIFPTGRIVLIPADALPAADANGDTDISFLLSSPSL